MSMCVRFTGKTRWNSLIVMLSTDCRNPLRCRHRGSTTEVQGHQWIVR